ncbi:MAG: hypothetical protein OXN92_14605 [Gammaproteobacteria bacterium]|nr:hypothetical protein [Gemmatimonadota bacterium]MDE0358947.1 hypothetical protein [Gammaproteobacteria bacterium]
MATRREYPGFDADTGRIRDYVRGECWSAQDGRWSTFIRQVQDNIRMVEGRHWEIWVPRQGRFVDVRNLLDKQDRQFFQRPVMNYIGHWFALTHAKLTENPPVMSYLPATSDAQDADLAEIMDTIFKYLWADTGMDYQVSEFVGMVLAAGEGVVKSWWDPDLGEARPMTGPGEYPILDGRGEPVIGRDGRPVTAYVEIAPYRAMPRAGGGDFEIVPMIEPTPGGGYREVGPPSVTREGGIAVRKGRLLDRFRGRTRSGVRDHGSLIACHWTGGGCRVV